MFTGMPGFYPPTRRLSAQPPLVLTIKKPPVSPNVPVMHNPLIENNPLLGSRKNPHGCHQDSKVTIKAQRNAKGAQVCVCTRVCTCMWVCMPVCFWGWAVLLAKLNHSRQNWVPPGGRGSGCQRQNFHADAGKRPVRESSAAAVRCTSGLAAPTGGTLAVEAPGRPCSH